MSGMRFLCLLFCISLSFSFQVIYPEIPLHTPASEVQHTCIHDHVQRAHGPPKLTTVEHKLDIPHVSKRETTFDATFSNVTAPIRMLFDYSSLEQGADPYTCYAAGQIVGNRNGGNFTCRQKDVVTPAMANWISHVAIPQAKTQWENILRVNPVVGNISFTNPQPNGRDCWAYNLQPNQVPQQYINGVTGHDLIIFITARPVISDCAAVGPGQTMPNCTIDTSVLAFAGSCLADRHSGRPLAGFFNYNPSLMDPQEIADGTIDFKSMGTTVHEITHVLGFSAFNFNESFTYEDPDSGYTYIHSPTVASVARDHFDCPSLIGATLENLGGGSTAGSHWKKMYFGNEYMTGEASSFPVFSRLTMALLRDLGWYFPDFNSSEIETLQWGLGLGCAFATQECAGRPQTMPYRCTELSLSQYSCTVDRTSKGRCSIPAKTATNPTQSDPLTGTCYTIGDFAGSQCYLAENAPEEVFDAGELYGLDSRCFDSSLVNGVPVGTTVSQRCYRTACAGSQRLKIQLGGLWYNCTAGATLSPDDWGGELVCPANYNLCHNVQENSSWPEIHSVEPSSGNPDDWVTIRGSGFAEGATVTISADCKNIEVVSSTEIRAQLAGNDQFRDPTHLIAQNVPVVVKNPNGLSAVGIGAYKVQVLIDAGYLNSLFDYFGQYPVYTGLVCVGIVFFISLAVFYCFRERRKALYGRMNRGYDFKEEATTRA